MSPASRPPATSGTASRSSTSRCPDGGCGPSTPPSSGPSATGSSIRRGRRSPATPRACSATASAPSWPMRSRRRSRRARPVPRQARRHIARPDQERSRPAALRHGRRRGGLPDQLRALPRPRRPGLRRLSQPQRRRMAVGRHDRGHPQDHQLRRALGPEGGARLADAALRSRQAARRRADRRRGRVCAVADWQVDRPGRGRQRPENLSPTSAPPATAPTARASRSRVRPT